MGEIVERTATLRSGLRLPYGETGSAGGPDEPAAVVLVHAFAESWRYFDPVLRALPARVHALAPTQRGHRSVVGPAGGFDVGDLAADVVDFTVAVRARPVVLVGASSGGLVAQAVAAAHPRPRQRARPRQQPRHARRQAGCRSGARRGPRPVGPRRPPVRGAVRAQHRSGRAAGGGGRPPRAGEPRAAGRGVEGVAAGAAACRPPAGARAHPRPDAAAVRQRRRARPR